jgi:two-component system nitrate/nitrite sensor histidine kinase NarX
MNKAQIRPSSEHSQGDYRRIFETAIDGLILIDLDSGLVVEANPAACKMQGYPNGALEAVPATTLIHPDHQHEFSNHIRAVHSRNKFVTQVMHVRRDGSRFHGEWHGTAIEFQGKLRLLGVIRDVSRRVEAEHRLHQRAETRTLELEALLELSHDLASTLELQPNKILKQLNGIIEYARAGFFGLEDQALYALAVRGAQQLQQATPFQVHQAGAETLAALFKRPRPVRIADIRSADPAGELLQSVLTGEAGELIQGMRAWMWVPLAIEGRLLGSLGFAHRKIDYFTPHHASLSLSMADQIAIKMHNAELYQQVREVAALQERQALARNLHDAVNQSLFSAGLIAEVLPRLWERDPVEGQQSLEDLRRLTRGALAEMRGLLAELRPSALTDSSLGDLLGQLATAFTGRTNVPVEVSIAGEHILPGPIQVAFYRICQEALMNIAKHAGASQVEIALLYEESSVQRPSSLIATEPPHEAAVESLEMRIRDNGRGFETSHPASSGHYGLKMIHERAEAVGAQLTVTSQPGGGTEIIVRCLDVHQPE